MCLKVSAFAGPVENVRRLVLLHPDDDPLIFTEMLTYEDDALMQVRNCLKKGVVLLDEEAVGFDNIVNVILSEWVKRGSVRAVATNAVRSVLLAKKQHLGAVPGENYFEKTTQQRAKLVRDENGSAKYVENGGAVGNEDDPDDDLEHQPEPLRDIIQANRRMMKRMPSNIEGAAILIGRVVQLERATSAFVRLKYPQHGRSVND
ncbi:band 3 cytoplasmic domain protein [Oesophagostomum dentatum]|uniref:Band 3 cytoplasmic domain protein n=1 Tax=Oesophagostomum dentatum TaxID=61180 RepID=A0A0B1S5L4_OESDE|nr:band 3 cytoplasmic domain protein [Oesophagostomum dentatum]